MSAAKTSVNAIVEELKDNKSARFSKTDFQALVYGVLADKEFKAKKYVLKNDELQETENDIGGAMMKFLDKVLKHAGMDRSEERQAVLDSFEYGPRDIEWIVDCVDEAMYQYTEADKSLRLFRDKMLQLTIKKMVRSGKYDGKVTYKKSVVDRALALRKRNEKKS